MTYDSSLAVLADPTRRAIFEAIAARPRSVADLASRLPVSRPAVSQHLKALTEAGLAEAKADGTRRIYSIRPEGLKPLRDWLDRFWDEPLAAFAAETERRRK
ncbi:MAG: metalloregulator ArsR/SmtB family transcription factor [Pseudomonadota bacterium]